MQHLTQLSLRGLLFIVAGFALGCWWLAWPDAVAQRFVSQCCSSSVPDAELLSICSPTYHLTGFHEMLRTMPDHVEVEAQERTLEDVINGRRKYIATGDRGRHPSDGRSHKRRSERLFQDLAL